MRTGIWITAAMLSFFGGAAEAEVPAVVVDVGPVHSLAAQVMAGLGEPAMVVRQGASPHGYAMRPSEAAALQRADVVFYVSGDLTRWFEEAVASLAGQARPVELMQSPGTTRLGFREAALFAADEESHAEEGHAEDEDHAHEGLDPHGWLDPDNARLWLDVIAAELAAADPEHADTYRANARAGQEAIAAAAAQAQALLKPLADRPFFVHHDAYQYFEHRFGLRAAGAVTPSDAAQAGPRRVAELRAAAAEMGAVCIFSEPQFNPAILATVFEGRTLRRAALDPLGTGLDPGPGLYPALIDGLAQDVASCLAD